MLMARVRRIFLYPEASQVLSAMLPALENHILAPHQLLAVAFAADDVEEAGFGIWVPASGVAAADGEGAHADGRVLLPWRFVATMTEYEDPTVEGSHHDPIGFGRAQRVG